MTFKIRFTVQDMQHMERLRCVSHVLKHFLRSTPSTTGAHTRKEGRASLFSESLGADDFVSPIADFCHFLVDLGRTDLQFEITRRTDRRSCLNIPSNLIQLAVKVYEGNQKRAVTKNML